jgi:hypothetical protein
MARTLSGIMAVASLAVCLLFCVVKFQGKIDAWSFKTGFLLASAAWFIFASLRIGFSKKRKDRGAAPPAST